MITLLCYLSILTAIFVCVCGAQGGWGVHEQHTDEFPAYTDQITLPTLYPPLPPLRFHSFSQSCLLPVLFSASLSAGKQLDISLMSQQFNS